MTGIGRLAVTLKKATDRSRLRVMTTVAEHLFDSSFDTPRVAISATDGRMNISAELAEIASYGGFFGLTVGGDPTGWHPVTQAYANGFSDLIDATIERYGTPEVRIGASLVHLGHAARLWSPVLACVLSQGVVPDLTNLQRADNAALLRLPDPIGEPAAPSPELLYRVVIKDHMEPFAAGLRAKLAPALLSGNIASALVGASRALISARPDLRQSVASTTAELLSMGRLAGSGVIAGADLSFRRNSCCLYYRLPGAGKCGDCPL